MKRAAIIIAIAVIVIAGSILLFLPRGPLYTPERKAWKKNAIVKINQRYADRDAVMADVQKIARIAPRAYGQWFSDDIVVMENGEWIVCQSMCHKQDRKIHDIFIGRGSDGKWYYSTFHFCVGKTVLSMQSQAASLAEFIREYSLVEFDGKSNECLKATWGAQ